MYFTKPVLQVSVLFLFFSLINNRALSQQHTNTNDSTKTKEMTVAKVYPPGKESVRITFYESARFYTLMKANKNFAALLRFLKRSAKENLLLKVTLTEAHGDIIQEAKYLRKNPPKIVY